MTLHRTLLPLTAITTSAGVPAHGTTLAPLPAWTTVEFVANSLGSGVVTCLGADLRDPTHAPTLPARPARGADAEHLNR